MSQTLNILTIDVEDWFHILGDAQGAPKPSEWDTLPSRVVDNTKRLMDLIEEAQCEATFFILGWVARKYPHLIREAADRGFDIACHGDQHGLVHEMKPDAFRRDVAEAIQSLEDASGKAIKGYRAAGFSITKDTPWAFDVLAEAGIAYDASVFPGVHAHGGIRVPFRKPFLVQTSQNNTLYEFPVAATQILNKTIPFGGGGYFRLLPEAMTSALIQQMNREDIPATLYLHPREIDPDQPRMKDLSALRKFKYYVNLGSTEEKLRGILGKHRFQSISSFLDRVENRVDTASRVVHIPS